MIISTQRRYADKMRRSKDTTVRRRAKARAQRAQVRVKIFIQRLR